MKYLGMQDLPSYLVRSITELVHPDILTQTQCSGFSMAISILCIFYLIKNWKRNQAHIIVTCFSLVLTSLDIGGFVLKTISTQTLIVGLLCNPGVFYPLDVFNIGGRVSSIAVTTIFCIGFLAISDAFLVGNNTS
jgi:hypothetical protein